LADQGFSLEGYEWEVDEAESSGWTAAMASEERG
jgi:hypothetical protein